MLLNEKQQRILSMIDAGHTTGEGIANAIGSSMQMIRYYLDTLSEDGYLKVAKVYDNATREFQVVRAYLTDKGKAALVQVTPEAIQTAPTVGDEVEQIIQALDRIQLIVEALPSDRSEIACVYLEDLQNEMKVAYRRKPQRIKAYFLALLETALPAIEQTGQLDLFIEDVRFLANRFNVAVKLPENVG
jgi:DeoR family transcriptional regulator, catabolite repression regulator